MQRSALGLGSLGLLDLLSSDSASAAKPKATDLLKPHPAHARPTAKRVIHFFLNGGPSHVDTFDRKPALERFSGRSISENLATERKTGAALPSPFRFRKYGESGIEVSELFDRTAQHIDDIAIIRSMHADVPNPRTVTDADELR